MRKQPLRKMRIFGKYRLTVLEFTGYLLPLFIFWVLLTGLPEEAMAIDLVEMSLEELMDVRIKPVVSASKYEQKSMEAPSSMTIVTAEQIRQYGYRTLGEVLQGVRGFYIRNDRNYSMVGYRGFSRPGDYSTRILLLLDGLRINDNIYDQASVGHDFILDLDLIQRIEIVRGPSYAIYGNNAFFVVVNVISKSAQNLDGLEVSVDMGRFDTYKNRFSLGKQFQNDGRFLFSGSLLGSKGQTLYFPEFDTLDQNNGIARNCDKENAGSMFARYDHGDFTLSAAYAKRGKQIPTAPWETVFNDERTQSWDERAFFDVKINHRISDHLDMAARLSYGLYTYEGRYAFYDEALEDIYINRDDSKGEWLGIDFHMVRKFSKHTLLFGGEFRDNFTLIQKNFDAPGEVYLKDHNDAENWGIFVQDEYALSPSLKLNAGLRYDHFSTFGGCINPRVALIYRPLPETALKYIAGKAFRAPNSYELFYNDGGYTQKADPDLENERILSHELIWEQIFGRFYSGTITLYQYKIENLISQITDTDDLLVYRNQDIVDAKGFEIEISGDFLNDVKGTVSYGFQKSDYRNSLLDWTNSPAHLAKFNLSFPFFKTGLRMGLEEQYTGTLDTMARQAAGNYWITNATLTGKDIIGNLDLSLSIYNLFNKNYELPGTDEHVQDIIAQDGRNFRIKLDYGF